MPRILMVEDEPDIALGLQQDLVLDGYEVEIVGTAKRARACRPRIARLDPARRHASAEGRLRRLPRAATVGQSDADHRADGPRSRSGESARGSNWAPTTTSPSRSARRSFVPGSFDPAARRRGSATASRLDRELRTAADVQQRLFRRRGRPQLRSTTSGYCQPALLVGGDYYDLSRSARRSARPRRRRRLGQGCTRRRWSWRRCTDASARTRHMDTSDSWSRSSRRQCASPRGD